VLITSVDSSGLNYCIETLKGELRSILTLSKFFGTFEVLSVQTKIGVAYTVTVFLKFAPC